jgi:hypothetical protein
MSDKIDRNEPKFKLIKYEDIERIFIQYVNDEEINLNENVNKNVEVKIPLFYHNSSSNKKLKEKLKKKL